MMRELPSCGETLIKTRERLMLRVYDDKQPNVELKSDTQVIGVLTAGWGHTGAGVKVGMQVTPDLAQHWFKTDLTTKVVVPLFEKIGGIIFDLTPNQYGAICSFVFNLGTGDPKRPEWTIWRRLRAKQFDQVPIEMAKFVNWNGKKSRGLVNRRNEEIALWSLDEPGSEDSSPPSSVTRREPTPPTQADPTPLHRSGVVITSIATAATAGPAAVSQAIEALEPYAGHSQLVSNALQTLAVVGGLLAVLGVVLVYLNHRRNKH